MVSVWSSSKPSPGQHYRTQNLMKTVQLYIRPTGFRKQEIFWESTLHPGTGRAWLATLSLESSTELVLDSG